MSGRRVVVTGGAGFIGSHVVERLLADGHTVIAVDNLATGRPDNLQHLRHEPRLQFAAADVTDEEALTPILREADWVLHLAALADIVPSIERPMTYYRANVSGTAAVLEAARRSGVKRFVYTASSSCYGIPDRCPTAEDAPLRPQYPYALTKMLGEQLVLHWADVYKLPVVSLRLFNVYGPRSRTAGTYGAVFGVFLAQKLAGQPFTVVGDGSQTRDFVFVTDVAEAFVRAAASPLSGEILNVGGGAPQSITRLTELLGGPVVHVPKRPGEPECTWADITKIRRLLGWQPSVSFDEGVRIMLEHIAYWRDAPIWTPDRIAEATREWFACLS